MIHYPFMKPLVCSIALLLWFGIHQLLSLFAIWPWTHRGLSEVGRPKPAAGYSTDVPRLQHIVSLLWNSIYELTEDKSLGTTADYGGDFLQREIVFTNSLRRVSWSINHMKHCDYRSFGKEKPANQYYTKDLLFYIQYEFILCFWKKAFEVCLNSIHGYFWSRGQPAVRVIVFFKRTSALLFSHNWASQATKCTKKTHDWTCGLAQTTNTLEKQGERWEIPYASSHLSRHTQTRYYRMCRGTLMCDIGFCDNSICLGVRMLSREKKLQK